MQVQLESNSNLTLNLSIRCLPDSLRCHHCGQNYKESTSLLIHSASKHNALGANFPTMEAIQVAGCSIQAKELTEDLEVTSEVSSNKTSKPKKKKLGKAEGGLRVCQTGAVSIVRDF